MTRWRRLRAVGRWATDWRNGATLAASLLVVVVFLVVNDAVAGRRDAFEALKAQTEQAIDARRAATRRIDLLQAKIDELVARGEVNAAVLGELAAEVDALRAQVRSLGADPVVDDPRSPSTTARPAPPTSTTSPPAPSPTSTTSTTSTTAPPRPGPEPPGDPAPLVCDLVPIPFVC